MFGSSSPLDGVIEAIGLHAVIAALGLAGLGVLLWTRRANLITQNPKIVASLLPLVPFSAEQMYQLVNDVHSYPDFLPGCTGSRVLNATSNEMTAAVDVAAH